MKSNATYQDDVNHCLQETTTLKIIDTSYIVDTSRTRRDSTTEILDGVNNICYISETREECEKYNVNVEPSWKEYNEDFIPLWADWHVIEFKKNNPYNLRYLLRTDNSHFLSFGKITFPEPNKNYQSSPWLIEDVKNNPYIVNCDSFDNSPFKDEIITISRYAKADIGAVACTNSNSYAICLRGPAEKIVDFKEWLISVTNPRSLILTEDKKLAASIRISGGLTKSLHESECDDKLKRLFDINRLRELRQKVPGKNNKIA